MTRGPRPSSPYRTVRADDVFRANGAPGGLALVRALATSAVCAAALAAPVAALALCVGAP